MKLLLFTLVLCFQSSLSATPYDSKILKTKDYEEMRELLNTYIENSQQVSENGEDVDSAISELKKGMKILLMRPDTDFIKSSLISILQNEIIKYRSFMTVLQEVIEKATSEFKSKKGSVVYQVSLLYLIENSLSYLKSINNKESTAILKKVKTANLTISKKIFNYLLLEMGRGKSASPSYLAGQILNKRQKEQRKEALRKAKEEKQAKKLAQKKNKKSRDPSFVKPKNSKDLPKPTIKIDL